MKCRVKMTTEKKKAKVRSGISPGPDLVLTVPRSSVFYRCPITQGCQNKNLSDDISVTKYHYSNPALEEFNGTQCFG